MTQIATVMYNLGEISYASTLIPYSLSYLNAASHLTDKTAPFSISDWYGYNGDIVYTYYMTGYSESTLEDGCASSILTTLYSLSSSLGLYTNVYIDIGLTTAPSQGFYIKDGVAYTFAGGGDSEIKNVYLCD